MQTVKMVVSDMDGTLLNSSNEVSSKFFSIFKELKAQNIIFVAASGRPYYSIVQKLRPIANDIVIIAENGGLVINQNTLLHSNALSFQDLKRISEIIHSIENAHPIFCTRHKAFINRTSAEFISTFSEYYSNYELIDTIDAIEDDVIKIALYHPSDSETLIYPHVEHLSLNFKVVVSGRHWVDISSLLTNKGYALDFLQKRFNISPSETMAFGDYNNDYEMLQLADLSYAMSNAHQRIKTLANYHTKSNDDYGVEIVLEALVSNNGKH